ncbi:hypothetical protein [Vibrio gigantis]|nr:hypothetical protein [Vibrio gigantis]
MYSITYTSSACSTVHAVARLPAPNRHIHSHGHHRTPQKSG